jgi:hypothetical protein
MFMKLKILLSFVLSVMMSPAIARACSVCFSGDDDAITHAFNWSVGFLLAAPYAIAGTIAACLVIAYRKAAARRATLDEGQTIDQLILTQEENAK